MCTKLHIAAFAASLAFTVPASAQPIEYSGNPVSTTVFVSFPHGGAVFRPPLESLETLAAAKDAAMITIRGRERFVSGVMSSESA